MAKQRKRYRVEVKCRVRGWSPVGAGNETLGYCHGYVDAKDSHYPCPPHRIVVEGTIDEVVRETKGRSAVTVN